MSIDLRGVDITRMAEDDGVQLKGSGTRYGACPKCGGVDRFGVIVAPRATDGAQLWFCRQCHPNESDAVEYLRHVRGMVTSTKEEWRTMFKTLRAYGMRDDRRQANSSFAQPKLIQPAKPITREGIPIPERLDDPPESEWQDLAAIDSMDEKKCLWSPDGARALSYLRSRRMLTDETIHRFDLGFCKHGDRAKGTFPGITIPVSYADSIWSVKTRTNETNGMPKYAIRRGSKPCVPFNGDALADESITHVIICEGEFDCMLLDQHIRAISDLIPRTAAITFGGKDFKPNYEAIYLLRSRRCFIALDADQPGDDAYARHWSQLGERLRVPEGKDITDYAQRGHDLQYWLAAALKFDGVFRRLGEAEVSFG